LVTGQRVDGGNTLWGADAEDPLVDESDRRVGQVAKGVRADRRASYSVDVDSHLVERPHNAAGQQTPQR
jgi:hypothetical protein